MAKDHKKIKIKINKLILILTTVYKLNSCEERSDKKCDFGEHFIWKFRNLINDLSTYISSYVQQRIKRKQKQILK